MIEISTKTKNNLDKLVESIILQAELLDLKADHENEAKGTVLESKIAKITKYMITSISSFE